MRAFCAVKGCGNKKFGAENKNRGIIYHGFPFHSKRVDTWIRFCGWPDSWRPKANQAICSVHFDARDYDERIKHRRQLKPNAMPSIGGHQMVDNEGNTDYSLAVDFRKTEPKGISISSIGGHQMMHNKVNRDSSVRVGFRRIAPKEIVQCQISSNEHEDIVMNEESDDDAYEYEEPQNDTIEGQTCKICHSQLLPDAKNLLQQAAVDKTYKDVVEATLHIEVHSDDVETMRICEKCSNFIEDLHSFAILCREGLSRIVDKTPQPIISELQTSDEDDDYDYDTVSADESIPDQQREQPTPLIPELTIVHDNLRFKPVMEPDAMDPLSSLDIDSEEAGSCKTVDQNQTVTCRVCSKVCTSKRHLQVHMNLHTKMIKYPCQHCDEVFYARRIQRDHEQTHLDKTSPSTNPDDHRCGECGSVYLSEKQLEDHLQLQHSGIRKQIKLELE